MQKIKIIETSEMKYNKQINELVSNLLKGRKKIVLLAGPSGSGKTTTAKRIIEEIQNRGYTGVYLSMDNWFRTKAGYALPLTDEGEPDYESPLCVDIDLLNSDLHKLLEGSEIKLPTFDFVNECMIFKGNTLKLKSENDIIVIEGLHALNSYLDINREISYRVYVCPNKVEINGEIFNHEDIRLYRRISRDCLHRGREEKETIELFKSVKRGEELYLYPTLTDLDFKINSYLDYELYLHKSVLKDLPKLQILDNINISLHDIPKNSIMTEFYF